MSIRITCINKSNGNHQDPHEAISNYGWLNETSKESGKADRQSMVDWIKKGNTAYVKDPSGSIAYCGVRTSANGKEFLQTYSDNKYTNNLLSLMECR